MLKFLRSTFFNLLILFLVNVAGLVLACVFNVEYIYFGVTVIMAFVSIFFLANRKERDAYKVTVFLLMLILPMLAIGYGVVAKEKKGNKKIKKEWSDIMYRNRKSVFSSSETMQNLKATNSEVYKTCAYLVDTTGLPCFQNARIKYYSFGDSYYKDLFEECKNAKNFILFECYKIKPGKLWQEFFDILRVKSREGVQVRLIYDDSICTKYIPNTDFLKMRNHGIETVPFNKAGYLTGSFSNCRNYKRICVVDGKVGFFSGFNVDDRYMSSSDETVKTIKDCGIKIMGEAVKNLTVMFYEDYQFATKKVVNLQEYFADTETIKTKDWLLPYSTNPVSLDNTNKNIILSMINNAKESISITTSYLALDDELKNALIVNARSGVKVKLVFCGEKQSKSIKNLSRSFFYDLVKEGIEVYDYRGGFITTRLIMVDSDSALISTNNLDCSNTYRHFNAGVYIYGESVILMYNDMREIINNSQLISIKDLQKRRLLEKISATWNKFINLFR